MRVKTNLWVSAEIRRCETCFISAVIVFKGDAERGLVLLKHNLIGQGFKILTQSHDMDGNLNWVYPLGDELLDEQKADQYITRQRKFDEDLWVIEIDDPKGHYGPLNNK
jgi:hypothetical protein